MEARNATARIIIGSGTRFNNNCVVSAEHTSIRIGRDVLFGPSTLILDSDGHVLDPTRRHESPYDSAAGVVIGDNCFLGAGVSVFKGVSIGTNSVVGSGSVVVDDIPADVVAAGNPARVIRKLG
jgi:maltose O-acetyltransferase